MYTEAELQQKCLAFENTVKNDSAYGAYYAIQELCGPYLTGVLVERRKLNGPGLGLGSAIVNRGRRVAGSSTQRRDTSLSDLEDTHTRAKRRKINVEQDSNDEGEESGYIVLDSD